MSPLAPYRRLSAIIACLLVSVPFFLVACVPDANNELISPDLGPKLVLARSEGNVEAAPTPAPPKLAELTPDQIYAGLPADLLQAVQSADIGGAETIALKYGCVGCHSTDPTEVKTGPTWHNVGDTAITRVPGESPAEYLHQSIINPNAYVVNGYPSNVMPQTFSDQMSQDELATMIAYLLSQNGQ
ncbi:MAG: c-type cytochrome [Caldilineaceae bacterium]